MNTIISKRTGTFTYTKWIKANGQFFQDGPGIIINGGAGIVGGAELLSGIPMEKRTSIIPVGVHTYVDDEVLAKLMSIAKFRKDLERGIIYVVKGKQLDQDKTDDIAENKMIEDCNIPTRPITQDEMEAAGMTINKDGSVDIGEMDEGDSPMRQRKIEAGLPAYQKAANRNARKRRVAESKKQSGSRKRA